MALKEEDHTVSLELIKAFDDKEHPMITNNNIRSKESRLVGRMVCHNSLKGQEVTLPCSLFLYG